MLRDWAVAWCGWLARWRRLPAARGADVPKSAFAEELRAEIGGGSQEELQGMKLQAEILELRLKTVTLQRTLDDEQRARSRNRWIARLGLPSGLLALALAIFQTYEKGSTLWEQRQRDREVQLTETMARLIERLEPPPKSGDGKQGAGTAGVPDTAALSLSAYERDAVPFLLWRLQRTDKPAATIEALRMVKAKRRVGTQALWADMSAESDRLWQRTLNEPTVSAAHEQALGNYAGAIGELFKDYAEAAKTLLHAWDKKIEGLKPPRLPESSRNTLLKQFCDARGMLGDGTQCTKP